MPYKDKIKRLQYNRRHQKTATAKAVAFKSYLLRVYGISLEDYTNLLNKQKNLCANCGLAETAKNNVGQIKRLAIDHCHKTGKVRWLLCHSCNWGLAAFKDNPKLLRNMANLLESV